MNQPVSEALFANDVGGCKECHRTLPKNYTEEVCPACKERLLFSKVKEYIRNNDVTEYDVAREFSIPLMKVKGWIREGRIEYKELNNPTLQSLHCQECGKSISFGSLCPDCLRKANVSGSTTFSFEDADQRFRFLQK